MTNQDIACVAGGQLTAAPVGLTVIDQAGCRITATPLPDHAWRVETATPGWFVFHHEQSGQVLVVSSRDDTEVILATASAGTRHHWRIICYPERGNVVIISRVTGLALTAGRSDGSRPSRVELAAYCGAATQHWSFTDHQRGTNAILFEP